MEKENNSMKTLPQATVAAAWLVEIKRRFTFWDQCRHVCPTYTYKSTVVGVPDLETVDRGYSSEHDRDYCLVYRSHWNFSGSWNARSVWNSLHLGRYHERRGNGLFTAARLGKSRRKKHTLVETGWRSLFFIGGFKLAGNDSY